MKWQRFVLMLVTIFLMGVQTGYTRDISDGISFNINSENVPTTEESLFKISIPVQLVQREGIKAATAPGTQIVEMSRLDFDPVDRLVIMEGVAELPANILADMDEIAGHGKKLQARHRFNISFKLPSAKKVALTRYVQIEFVEFKLGGHSYLNAMHRLTQFVVGMLVNTSFMNYMMNDNPSPEVPEGDLIMQIKAMIESKALRFRGNTIAFKLDLGAFPQMKNLTELKHLRVWKIEPTLLKGTNNQIMLTIEAGLGRPSDEWLTAADKRRDSDIETLKKAREEFYREYSDVEVLITELIQELEATKKHLGLEKLNEREKALFDSLIRTVRSRASEALSMKNELFVADPIKAYDVFKRDAKEYIIAVTADINRKHNIDSKVKNGGSNGNVMPFLEKRLSQDTISQAVRYFRDFEFEGEQMFPELNVILNPNYPGITLRGKMNMNISVLMEMGLEGAGIQWDERPWRAAEDRHGAAMPFEAGLRITMLDGGWLGLDVESFSVLDGSEKIFLKPNDEHGAIVANWVKMAIVTTIATTLIDQAAEEQPEPKEPVDTYKIIRGNIDNQRKNYVEVLADENGKDLDAIIKLARIDIEKNPFLLAGKELVAGKAELFFKDLIKYDEESGLIMVKLDPRIASDTIMASDNTVQVWNVETLFNKNANKTFIDLALGDGVRTKKYLNHIHSRPEYKDSQKFVGVNEAEKITPSDMSVKVNLQDFEQLINKILKDAYIQQKKDVDNMLKNNDEVDSWLIEGLRLFVERDGVLRVNMTVTHINKSERGILNPARWFGNRHAYGRDTIKVSAVMGLSVEPLSKYKSQVQLSPNEVFLGKELLRFDLLSAGMKFEGKVGVLKKIVNAAIGNVDFKKSSTARWIKKLLLKFSGKYLNERDPSKNGNTELGGVKINMYAKLFAHNEELLLQINPHIMNNAFDMRLLPNQKFNGTDLGLILKKSTNTISFDFSTESALAGIDKTELLNIMKEGHELFKPMLGVRDAETLRKLMIDGRVDDRFFYNSDETKLSLMHRFSKVLSQYNGVLKIVRPKTDINDQFEERYNGHRADLEQLNRWLQETQGAIRHTEKPDPNEIRFSGFDRTFDDREISSCGVELMYFASAALILKKDLDNFIDHVNSLDFDVNRMNQYVSISRSLEKRFIEPLLAMYAKEYARKNQMIVKKGPTDWNHTFYPDAVYSDAVYKKLVRFINR